MTRPYQFACYHVKYQLRGDGETRETPDGPFDYWLNAVSCRNRFFKAGAFRGNPDVVLCYVEHFGRIKGKVLQRA